MTTDWLSDTASTLDGWSGQARLSHLQGRTVILELQGSKGRFRGQFVLIESFELIEREISHVERTRRPSTATQGVSPDGTKSRVISKRKISQSDLNAARGKSFWTVDELKRERLPLYWNKEWLRTELARFGSYEAVAAEHGYGGSTVRNYAVEQHGFKLVKPKIPEAVKQQARDLWRTGTSKKAISEQLSIAIGSVFAIVKDVTRD
jgi:hypothetical protein